jgi:hypothetical protein
MARVANRILVGRVRRTTPSIATMQATQTFLRACHHAAHELGNSQAQYKVEGDYVDHLSVEWSNVERVDRTLIARWDALWHTHFPRHGPCNATLHPTRPGHVIMSCPHDIATMPATTSAAKLIVVWIVVTLYLLQRSLVYRGYLTHTFRIN